MTEMTDKERAVIDSAIEINGGPSPGSMLWERFHNAVGALLAERAPKRCEPLAEFKNERWHWLKNRDVLYVGYRPSMADNAWWFVGENVSRTFETAAELGYSWHSVCRPEPEKVEVSDSEIRALWHRHSGGQTCFDCYVEFARAVLGRFRPAPRKWTYEEMGE